MKLPAPAGNAPAEPTTPAPDMGANPLDNTQPTAPSDDKPFDDEPFDAGVEADEATDPKKFIEQLTGKLGQSLRKYNDEQGQPDFDLEKFAINSLLSATHTAEMDEEDKNDIIKKVNTAGDNDSQDSDMGSDSNEPNNDNDSNDGSNNDFDNPIDGNDEADLEEVKILEDKKVNSCWSGYKQIGMKEKNGKQVPNCVPINENQNFHKMSIQSASGDKVVEKDVDDYGRPLFWSLTDDNINYFIGDSDNGEKLIIKYNAINGKNTVIGNLKHYGGSPRPKDLPGETLYEDDSWKEMDSIFLKDIPKNSMFAPEGSPEFMEQNRISEGLTNSKKMIILDKNKLKAKLQETFNQEDMTQPAVEPVTKPKTKPTTEPSKPSRRDNPFKIEPDTIPQPNPKALKEGKWSDMMKGVRREGGNPWSLVAIQNGKVIGQDINIKIPDLIPAKYEAFKKVYPNAIISLENNHGMIVWTDKNYK